MMNYEDALRVAEEYAVGLGVDTDGVWVGEQDGTAYADGGQDKDVYFEVGELHVVVSYSHIDDSYSARRSDGVVW